MPPPPRPRPLEARGGGTTPNSGEAGFGPEGMDREHSAPSKPSRRAGDKVGGKGRRRRGGGAQRATAGSAWGAVPGGGKGAPTKARAGPPGKRARDPTATSTRAVPRRPGTPAGLSTLGAPSPAKNRAPTRPPPRGGPSEPPSVRLLHPGATTRGKRPQARAARPVPARHPRRRLGTGAGGRQPLARRRARRRTPRGSGRARARSRTRTHAGAPRARRRPGPAGSSPDSEGGGAGRGRQESDARPHRGAGRPLAERGLCPTRDGSHPASVATTRRGGAAAGGSGTPRHPLGSLEKAFSPRAHRPHPFVPLTGLRPRKRRPKGLQGLGGGGGGSAARDRPRTILSTRGQSPTRGPPLPLLRTPCSHPRPEGTSGLHTEATRGAETGTACRAKRSSSPRLARRRSAGSARRGHSHAPPSPVHTHRPGTTRTRGRRGARTPTEGGGWASLTDFHHPLSGHTTDSGSPRGSLGTGNDATARPQAPETTWSAPGAPQRARRHALSTPGR